MYKESKSRSVVKTISWRILATATTITLVYIFTGKTDIAFSVGLIEVFLKMLIYFLHERAWDKIHFGRQEIQPFVLWFTGLTRSGKKDIAKKVMRKLIERGLKVEMLDGHTVRNIFTTTGFTRNEVNEHIERVGYLASKLENQGVFIIASFLSPYAESRDFVRSLSNNFIEVYVNTPLEICEERDETGIYKKARKGAVKNVPGIDVEYEVPVNAEVRVGLHDQSIDQAAETVFNYIKNYI